MTTPSRTNEATELLTTSATTLSPTHEAIDIQTTTVTTRLLPDNTLETKIKTTAGMNPPPLPLFRRLTLEDIRRIDTSSYERGSGEVRGGMSTISSGYNKRIDTMSIDGSSYYNAMSVDGSAYRREVADAEARAADEGKDVMSVDGIAYRSSVPGAVALDVDEDGFGVQYNNPRQLVLSSLHASDGSLTRRGENRIMDDVRPYWQSGNQEQVWKRRKEVEEWRA